MAIVLDVMGQEKRPAFEVASVKRSAVDTPADAKPRRSGDRIMMHNIRVTTAIIYAFHLADGLMTTSYQLAGKVQVPDEQEEYNIDAIAPELANDKDLRLMFQVLLEDRFKLKYHWEDRTLPSYDLTVAKKGLKLKPDDPKRRSQAQAKSSQPEAGVSRLAGSGSIEDLVAGLSGRLNSPVRNLTGLSGGWYEFDVRYARDLANTSSAADLVTAVEEGLGLKLKRSKRPLPVLIVEGLEKPTEN